MLTDKFDKSSYTASNLFPYSHTSLHPTRPLTSLLIGSTMAGLSYLGAVYFLTNLGSLLVADDVLFYPLQTMRRLAQNIKNGINSQKSWVRLMSTILGYVLGYTAAAYAIATISPAAMGLLATLGATLLTIAACEVLGIFIANNLNRPSYEGLFAGGFLGIVLAVYCSAALPPAFCIYGLMTLLGGFAGAVVSKQCYRAYHYLSYGHSNADTYFYNVDTQKQSELDIARAEQLRIRPAAVTNLRQSLLKLIYWTKQHTSYGERLFGIDKVCRAELKNLLHHLLNAEDSDSDVKLYLLLLITVGEKRAEVDWSKDLALRFSNVIIQPQGFHTSLFRQHLRARNGTDYHDTSFGLAILKLTQTLKLSWQGPTVEQAIYQHLHGLLSALSICYDEYVSQVGSLRQRSSESPTRETRQAIVRQFHHAEHAVFTQLNHRT